MYDEEENHQNLLSDNVEPSDDHRSVNKGAMLPKDLMEELDDDSSEIRQDDDHNSNLNSNVDEN